MTSLKTRQWGTAAAIPVAAAALLLASALPANATSPVHSFNNGCVGIPNSSVAGPVVEARVPTVVTVTHPTTADPNMLSYQLGVQSFNNSSAGATVQRVTRDAVKFELVNPSAYTNDAVVDLTTGFGWQTSGSASGPRVDRVNASGAVDPAGNYLMVWGGEGKTLAGVSPGGANSGTAGLTWPAVGGSSATTNYQVPALITKADLKLVTDGDAARFGNVKNYRTFLPVATFLFTTQNAPTYCMPTDVDVKPSDIGNLLPLNGGAVDLHP